MRITPERSRAIFGNPKPPEKVWEEQFDYCNKQLRKLARTDWRSIDYGDLWYYFHDMSYVELQPDLFRYLFPVCLNFWYDSLMRSTSAELGDAEFHYSLRQGNILEKMLTVSQRAAVFEFFHDGFIDRVEAERGFIYTGQRTPAYSWLMRFNSIGLVAPIIERIWSTWWKLDHPGKAVSAIIYATGLVYLKGENPIFSEWTQEGGGGGPYLTESDSGIYDAAWLPENLEFLKETLSVEYIQGMLKGAAAVLAGEPEAELSMRIAEDSGKHEDILQIRIDDLIAGLGSGDREWDW